MTKGQEEQAPPVMGAWGQLHVNLAKAGMLCRAL